MSPNYCMSFFSFLLSSQVQSSGGHVIEFIINQKKNLQLMIDSYPFHRCKLTKTKQYYCCAQASAFGCRARANIDHLKQVEVVNDEHNHPAIVPRKIAGACRKQTQAMRKLKPPK